MNLAVALLPLSVFTIMGKTAPFWTAILGYCFLSERILPIEIFGMIICFGAFLYITLANNDASNVEEVRVSTAGRLVGFIFIFCSAWLVAGLLTANRCLKGIDSHVVMFYHGLIGLAMWSLSRFKRADGESHWKYGIVDLLFLVDDYA